MRNYIEIKSADSETWDKVRMLHQGWRSPLESPGGIQRDNVGAGSLSFGPSYPTWSGVAKVYWAEQTGYAKLLHFRKWMGSNKLSERSVQLRTFYYDIETIDGIANPDYHKEYDFGFVSKWDPEFVIPVHDGTKSFSYILLQMEAL